MNWVDGEPLDEWVRRRPDRDPYETLNGTHSGHFTRAPVVHRDVKPTNILVTANGTVLVDFGLTRALPDGARLSGINGTVGYLAPEATDQGIYTPAIDRYALGAWRRARPADRRHDDRVVPSTDTSEAALVSAPQNRYRTTFTSKTLRLDPKATGRPVTRDCTMGPLGGWRWWGVEPLGPGSHPYRVARRNRKWPRLGLKSL